MITSTMNYIMLLELFLIGVAAHDPYQPTMYQVPQVFGGPYADPYNPYASSYPYAPQYDPYANVYNPYLAYAQSTGGYAVQVNQNVPYQVAVSTPQPVAVPYQVAVSAPQPVPVAYPVVATTVVPEPVQVVRERVRTRFPVYHDNDNDWLAALLLSGYGKPHTPVKPPCHVCGERKGL